MLKRKATNFLNNWKSGKRKSLIITGARQVGKTFTVRMFAKEKYETFYELNFLENPELKTIFSGSLE
ncbi:MAG TPA: AAA family ATPase, partial [Clostridia bacterium]|nr:AAA family ATPase [Clostridia bacterium]